MTRSILRITMSFSPGWYYELQIGQDNAESDRIQEVSVPLDLRRSDALSEDDGERSRDSGIEDGEDDGTANS